MRFLIPFAAVALAGCASANSPEVAAARAERDARDEAALAKALAGKVQSGSPQSCITLHMVRSSKTIGNRAVIYDMGGGLVYVNNLQGGCVGLDDRNALITRTPTSQLCRGDIATVADLTAGITTGSCVFGDFIPYRREG